MATEVTAGGEFLRFISQAAVVVVSWAVVHYLSARRDRDKARREMLAKSADVLGDIADKLLASARDYHAKPRDINLEISIKMTLQDLSLRTIALSDICADSQELAACRSGLLGLKRAITGKHFEDEHTGPLADSDAQLQEVASQVLRVKLSFLKLKHRQFPVA